MTSYSRLNNSVPTTFTAFYDFMEETGALSATQTHVLAIILNNIIDAKIAELTDRIQGERVHFSELTTVAEDGSVVSLSNDGRDIS